MAVIALALVIAATARAQDSNLVIVERDDPEMAQAIAKARSSLAKFWAAHEKPGAGEENFSLKVMIRDGSQVEHFWLADVVRREGKLEGTIGNAPQMVGNVQAGQRYAFSESDISDWMFIRNGKIVGNETMRPLLKRLPKAQAENYRAMLENP